MRFIASIIIILLFTSYSSFAEDRKTIFEGLDMRIISVVDAMTDEKSCALFVEFKSPIYIAIYDFDDYTIWPRKDNLLFAHDVDHLIRVGKQKPFRLTPLEKRNGLKPQNPMEAATVIKALLNGENVNVRYFDWPKHDKSDESLSNPNIAYAYNIGVKKCGWKDMKVSGSLAEVKLKVYQPDDSKSKGYATVKVVGNDDLSLNKGFDHYGGGCYITIRSVNKTFGMQKGEWTCDEVGLGGNKKIIIRDKNRNILFSEKVPDHYSTVGRGNPWPQAKIAAKAAWATSPHGSIEIEEYGMSIDKAVVPTKQCRFGNTVLFYFVNTWFFAMCCQKT